MGKGLAFLNLKFFHPGNRDNQQRKWEALQREAAAEKRAKARSAEMVRERELASYRLRIMASSGGAESEDYQRAIRKSQVAFLYEEPPGLRKALDSERSRVADEMRVAEWRSAMADMTRDERRLAERQMEEGLSIHERNARRFSYLKDAPMQAEYVKDMDVVHKPFGKVVKHVKCFKCGQWGHRLGDRLCPKSGHFTREFYGGSASSTAKKGESKEEGETAGGAVKKEEEEGLSDSERAAEEDELVYAEHCIDGTTELLPVDSEVGDAEVEQTSEDTAKASEDPMSGRYFSKRRRVQVATSFDSAGGEEPRKKESITDRYVCIPSHPHTESAKHESKERKDKKGTSDVLLRAAASGMDEVAYIQSLSVDEKRALLAELSSTCSSKSKHSKKEKERKRKRQEHRAAKKKRSESGSSSRTSGSRADSGDERKRDDGRGSERRHDRPEKRRRTRDYSYERDERGYDSDDFRRRRGRRRCY